MRIIVCSRKAMRSQWFTDKTWFNDKKKYFITISGIADDFNWAYPFNSSHVLRLQFDDITDNIEHENLMLFSEDDAKKIHEFIDSIHDKDCNLYVNCAAGISRSGAVGYCINSYVNSNNSEDFEYFEENNKQIQPNPYVKRILTNELFGETNWDEVFTNVKSQLY